jgi:hypothetical protein
MQWEGQVVVAKNQVSGGDSEANQAPKGEVSLHGQGIANVADIFVEYGLDRSRVEATVVVCPRLIS